MAARGGLGPTSPITPISPRGNMYSMNSAMTLDRHATVLSEPYTKSMDLPKSPHPRRSDSPDRRPNKGPLKQRTGEAAANDASAGWLSKLFKWKPADKEQGETSEYP